MSYHYAFETVYFISYKTANGLPFLEKDAHKKILLDQIKRTAAEYFVEVIAYAILSNHYHLLFQATNKIARPNDYIKQINGASSRLIHQTGNFVEKIWDKNFFSWAIAGERKFWKTVAYIAGNPLKHRVVKNFTELGKYDFCNYAELAQKHGESFLNNEIIEVLAKKNILDDYPIKYDVVAH